jgi:hypothetical protein
MVIDYLQRRNGNMQPVEPRTHRIIFIVEVMTSMPWLGIAATTHLLPTNPSAAKLPMAWGFMI